MNLAILPLAITMMAGPQIMSAIILVSTAKPVKLSTSFIAGVALATTLGFLVALAAISLLGGGETLGDSSDRGSAGNVIQYLLVGLLLALAVKNYVRRETVEPPRWLGALLAADWKRALKTGMLVIWLMPGDIVVLFTVAVNIQHNDAGFAAALPFIGATILVAALPLLIYLLLRRQAQRLMPRIRDWMNANSWLLNVITCVVFIVLIL